MAESEQGASPESPLSGEVLSYFLSEKEKVLVVSFRGPLNKASSATIDKVIQDIAAHKDARWIVLNFHDVTSAEKLVMNQLARLQKGIRDRSALLRLCFLNPALNQLFTVQGILRRAELAPDLSSALKSLKNEELALNQKKLHNEERRFNKRAA